MTRTVRKTLINGQWELWLPEHRAARPEWATGWERERLDSMHANIRPGDVVFDVGTEEGDMSALFATWATGEQSGGIVLVEPNPKVWPNVRLIWEANHLPPPLGAWVGFAASDVVIGSEQVGHAGWRGWPACAYGPVIGDHGFLNVCERPDVSSTTLDALSAVLEHVPDVITMDIEGAELLCLRGAEQILRDHKPLVYVSVHPQFSIDMYQLTEYDLYEYMADLGYEDELLAVDHEHHVFFHHPDGREPVA